MSKNELSQDYIKGFIDALEFVVKSFRGIQFNSQKTKLSNNVVCSNSSPDKSNSIKDSLDKDYSGTITNEMLKGTRFENDKHKANLNGTAKGDLKK